VRDLIDNELRYGARIRVELPVAAV